MAVTNKIISFWKQVRAKSSDMFTLFKVGVGVKVPTHKLHIKDSTDPIKVEGLQNDTTDPDKYLSIDSNNIIKYRTGAQLASDIEVSIDDLHGAGVDGAANQLLTDNGDGTVTSESKFIFDSTANQVTLGGDDINTVSIIRKTHSDADGGKIDIEGGDSGGTNKPGGDVRIYGGKGTGNAEGGAIEFYCSTPTSSGSAAHFLHGADMKISDQLVHVTGNITLSGTVDGRDVATDGTKLDGIEASADVTDTANVTAAGALMDSEVTNLSQVKAFDSSDYATAAQGAKADSAQQPPSEGAFVNGDKTKLDGIEASADVTDATNVTAAGALMDSELTDLAGIKSLDTSTIVTLADTQTIGGAKTFDRKLTLDANKNVTAGSDGVTLHIDAQDITDTSTSGSGTAASFNHVVVENPRLMATNSSVTTTNASTVYIKGAPVASTNQTITNAYALYVAGGNAYFGGDIIVAGNDIKDDDGTTCITFDSSGNTTITGDLLVDGDNITNSTSAINFNISSSRVLELQHAANFDVSIGDATNTNVLQVQGTSEIVNVNGALNVTGNITGKQYQVFPSNFIDEINTSRVFIPIHGTTFEQATAYQDDVAILAPCDGRIVSVTLNIMSVSASADLTLTVYTLPPNTAGTTTFPSTWVLEESEQLSITGSSDNHTLNFVFSNAKHFESTEKFIIAIQASSDPGPNTYIYATTVVEWDYSTLLSTTAEHSSAP